MNRGYNLDTSGGGSILSKNAWLLIIFAVLFIIYVFVPPINDAVNALAGSLFGPLIDMFSLATDSMAYLS